jgi:hypothetical protein
MHKLNIKKLLLATLVAFICLIIVNTLLFPLVFPEGSSAQYESTRDKPLYLFDLIAFIVMAFLLAYIYPIGYRGGRPRVEGLHFGMYMGLLVSLPHTFHVYATVDYDFYMAALAIIWTIVIWGATGIAIALVYGRRREAV